MNLTVKSEFTLTTHGHSNEDLPGHVDAVMRELIALEECDDSLTDSAVGLDIGSMTVEISVSIQNPSSYDQALSRAVGTIRAAIHAAGGFTPDWPGKPLKPRSESLRYEARETHAVLA